MAWFKKDKKPKTAYELKQSLIERDRSRKLKEHTKTKAYEAEKKYSGQQAERRAQAKYAPRKSGGGGGFHRFATKIGRSMENIGELSGTGPSMRPPSSYYQETARAVRKTSRKGKKGKGKKGKRTYSSTKPKPSGPASYHSYSRRY